MFTSEAIKLIVADSSQMGCQLLADALQRSSDRINVVARVLGVQGVLEAAAGGPSVALISVHLQDGALSGFEALRRLHELHADVRVIMLLDVLERELVISAFRGGARGVVSRAQPFDALRKCVHKVHEGQIWASNAELEFVLEAFASVAPLKLSVPGPATLTKREEQVIHLVAQGLTNREISRRLNLSEHTVKNYLFRIFDKLGISSRVELALYFSNRRTTAA